MRDTIRALRFRERLPITMAQETITFDENGFPVELVTERDFRKAIQSSRLKSDTLVRIYSSDGSVSVHPASSVDRLKPFFENPGGKRRPDPVESAAVPARADPPPAVDGRTDPAEAHDEAGALRETEGPDPVRQEEPDAIASPYSPEDTAPRDPDSSANDDEPAERSEAAFAANVSERPARDFKFGALGCAALAIALIFAAGIASWVRPPVVETNRQYAGDDSAMLNDAVEEPVVQEILGPPVRMFALRELPVRAEPSGSSARTGTIARGESVSVQQVSGIAADDQWMKLEGGALAGGYLWRVNLSDSEPRPLLRAMNENWSVARLSSVRAAPDGGAEELQSLPVSTNVLVLGELDGGWWELGLRNGGVGYLAPDSFEAPVDTSSQTRFIAFENACDRYIEVRLLYRKAEGLEDSDGASWSIRPGATTRLTWAGSTLAAASNEIYVNVAGESFPNERYFTYGSRTIPMTPLSANVDSEGDYLIRYTCN